MLLLHYLLRLVVLARSVLGGLIRLASIITGLRNTLAARLRMQIVCADRGNVSAFVKSSRGPAGNKISARRECNKRNPLISTSICWCDETGFVRPWITRLRVQVRCRRAYEEERGRANRQRDPGTGARKGRRRNGGKEEKRDLGSRDCREKRSRQTRSRKTESPCSRARARRAPGYGRERDEVNVRSRTEAKQEGRSAIAVSAPTS